MMEGERRALGTANGIGRGARPGPADPASRRPRACWSATRRPWSPGVLLRPLAQDHHAAHRRLRRRAGRDRVPRADRPLVRALRDPAARAAAAAERHPRGAGAGARAGGRGPQPARPAGRPRGPARALGARGPPGGGGGLRPHARGAGAGDGRGRGGAWAPSTPRCAPPPTPRAGARCTRSRPCTRSRCAPSRSATRRAPIGCAAPATRSCPAGSFQERGLGLVSLARPPRAGGGRRPAASASTPGRAATR